MTFRWCKGRDRRDADGEGVESDDPVSGIIAREGLDADEIARRLNRGDRTRRTSPESLVEAARKIA